MAAIDSKLEFHAANDLLPDRILSTQDEIERGHKSGVFTACKLYPAGATTNSDNGVTDIGNITSRARNHAAHRHAAFGTRRSDRQRH